MSISLNRNIELVAFDLDGTLLNDNWQVSEVDMNTLIKLGQKKVIRVAATGRNLLSIKRVLSSYFPIDYVVFSSGAGVIDWTTKELLVKHSINQAQITQIISAFIELNISFTINLPVPNSHNMLLHIQDENSHDLRNYTNFYKGYVSKFNALNIPKAATQVIGLLNHNKKLFYELHKRFTGLKLILTTSPVNHKSLWVEVFNKNVSKAKGIQWVQERHNLKLENTFSIGNDYNDIDMLNYTNYSFVVNNAPTDLLSAYTNSISNNESAFSFAINQVVNL